MRNKILMPVAAAFVLTSVAAPYAASAYPSPSQMHKAGEIKDPTAADAAVSKAMAKDAKKKKQRAHKDAQIAAHKAKTVAKDSDKGG